MGEISVIIVSWNARGYLRDCLNSLHQTSESVVREIIVVDNASTDGSPEMVEEEFPGTKLIRANENLGFARASNLGIKLATGCMLAFVNSDVIVHPECLQRLAAFLDHDGRAGLVGPKILGADGRMQFTCGKLPTVWNTMCRCLALDRVLSRWRLFSGFHVRSQDPDAVAQVEVLSGCFWVSRRIAVDQVGGLDERFFFYAEDFDWCKRYGDAGWKVMFVPSATATHFGGGSSSNAPLRYSIELLRASLLYWQKHYGNLGRYIFFSMAVMQHVVRLAARGFLAASTFRFDGETKHKLQEHIVCLRWLFTGKGL
jgi:GT2 family glycosyltransferase